MHCSCHKQCFCRLAGGPFKGIHYPPDANCPVCAKCPNSGSDDGDLNNEPSVPKQDFKCSCSFEGIGGAGISNGGYMECDCKVADCSCSKKCACKMKKSGGSSTSFKESLPPVLAAQEGVAATSRDEATAEELQPSEATSASVPSTHEKKSRRKTTPLRANSIVQTT